MSVRGCLFGRLSSSSKQPLGHVRACAASAPCLLPASSAPSLDSHSCDGLV